MARLPQPGSDSGSWGDILNDFLVQAHNPDGTLKDDAVSVDSIQDNSITEVKLDSATQTKLNAVAPVTSVAGKTGDVTLVKADVGLANVDNTSDANKPVSTATQTALNTKEGTITAGTTGQYYRGDKSWQTLDKTAVGLANVDNTSDANKPVSTAQNTADNLRVLKAGDTMTGTLTGQSLEPSADLTYNLGTTNYYSQSHVRRMYLNSSAYLDGNTAGNVDTNATLFNVSDGALRLGGATTTPFHTPAGSDVATKINIPLYAPPAFGQVVSMGIPDTAPVSARVHSLFDSRTTAHQPTLAVFNVGETDAGGFSWEGDTNFYVKTLGSNIVLRSNITDLMAFSASKITSGATIVSDTDSTDDLGSTSSYWANIYGDRLYINATAYLDGASAGVLSVTGDLQVGTAGTNNASVVTAGGAQTLTNKRVTVRTNTTASSATPAINTDTTDEFTITALATDITSMTTGLSGTPVNGDELMIRLKDDGVPRTIAWGASFVSSGVATLLATTAATKTHYVKLRYDSTAAKWVCLLSDSTGY